MQPTSLFENGIRGLSNSKQSGIQGSAYRVVGVDFHSEPGIMKAHQKLTKESGDVIDELCKEKVAVSDGSILWFSAESGKIWREYNGEYTLVHTIQRSDANEFPIEKITSTSTFFRDFNNEAISVYSAGITVSINPSGTVQPSIAANKRYIETATGTTLSTTVKANTDQLLIIYSGTFGDEKENIDTVTVNGNAVSGITSISGSSSSWEYNVNTTKYFPTTNGTQTINITYNATTPNRFVYVLVVDNASSITTSDTETGTATSNVISPILQQLNNLFITLTLSKTDARHIPDAGQKIISTDIIGNDEWNGRVSIGYKKAPAITDEVITLGASEYDGDVYYAVQSVLYKCPVSNVSDNFSPEIVGLFVNQDSQCHTMTLQNLQLFIADGQVIAKVDENKEFIAETNLNLKAPERITTIHDMGIDILIGTVIGEQNKGRVLAWDTESESWYAEDTIEERGINAFIRDDNYIYVQAGEFGKVFFYNGEQLIPFMNIPGDYSPTKKAIINQSSVTTLLGIPRFGLSNVSGNSQLQGIYSFGSYSKDYPKVLDLSFPISTGDMEDVTIGGIVSKGADMWVSWKQGDNAGIDKLDYSAKFPEAYIETRILTIGATRTDLVNIGKMFANYSLLPTGTNISFGIKRAYESDYTALGTMKDTKRYQVRCEENQVSLPAPQLRIGFISNGNETPEVESIVVWI